MGLKQWTSFLSSCVSFVYVWNSMEQIVSSSNKCSCFRLLSRSILSYTHILRDDVEKQTDSSAFPALLLIVLAEREKKRENDRESHVRERMHKCGKTALHTRDVCRSASQVSCDGGKNEKTELQIALFTVCSYFSSVSVMICH